MGTLNDFVNGEKKYYIYGAGVVGYYMTRFCLKNGINIINILVSNEKDNVDNYFGIKVIGIDELHAPKDECFIIIATLETKQQDIILSLKQKGFYNIYALKDVEYCGIRELDPEISAEIQQQILGLRRNCVDIGMCISNINRKIDCLSNNIKSIRELWKREFCGYVGDRWDKRFYYEEFSNILLDKNNYNERINNLVRGLSQESVEKIYMILERLNSICCDKSIEYTNKERRILEQIEEEFHKKIYTLYEGLHVYKNYYLPKRHFEQPVFWYRHGMEELTTLEHIKGKDIIDAGAYIGDSALILSEYTEGVVHSFEAEFQNYELMKETIKLNDRNNIIPINRGLSNKKDIEKLFCSDIKDSCNSMDAEMTFVNANNFLEIECTTVDDYVKDNNLQIGLIKTDVEGAEKKLLEGAVNTIREQRPTLIVSIYHSMDDFFTIKPWIENLQLGYKFKIFRPIIKGSFISETVLICEWEGWES